MTGADGGSSKADPRGDDAWAGFLAGFLGGDAGRGGMAAFSLFSRLQLLAAQSAFRCWSGLAQAYGAHQSSLMQFMAAQGAKAELSDDERRAVAEDLRAWLREVGEIASQEARLFQSELDRLGADLAQAAGEPEAADEYRRRWKYKE